MAQTMNLLAVIFFHFLHLAHLCLSSNRLLTPSHRAMVLPLYLSTPNSSRLISMPRRHLRDSPSTNNLSYARMRLYDDLLLNGYYTTRLWIGTPPQEFALIVDTGSTVTYVPCSNCEQCGRHQDPKFDPDSSSTYRLVQCNIDCTCDVNGVQCLYERQYAEMSTSSGVLGEDIISFGNQSELIPQRAVFGCENMETGDLFSQHADGIMGLGSGDLSIIDQLVEKGVINDSFSLCYGGMDIGGGAMVLGGISPPSDMVFSHSDPVRSPYYNIELKEMHVAGKKLLLSPDVFDQRYGTVLDSGTTYAYLPEGAFGAFKDAIMNELHSLKKIDGPDPNFKDVCFSGVGSDAAELSNVFPTVDMVFDNGQKLSLAPENYLFRHSKVHGAYCLGVFKNANDQTTLLGGIVVRNTLVMYDREHSKVGFWKTNCSELWERLHISDDNAHAPFLNTQHVTGMAPGSAPSHSAPASAPSHSAPASAPSHSAPASAPSHSAPASAPSHSAPAYAPSHSAPASAPSHSAPASAPSYSAPASAPSHSAPASAPSHLAPTSAPSESHYMIPEELRIGRITFEILLNKSYPDLQPHITELTDHIAHELNVSHSQVRVLNVSMRGNYSLIRLAILPNGSSEFFSHGTATTIINLIAGHHIQLPPTFGNYQVVQWNFEALTKRSSWKRLYVPVALAIIVTLIVGLSVMGVWLIWRRRQQTFNLYKPVDAPAPEQELQPL